MNRLVKIKSNSTKSIWPSKRGFDRSCEIGRLLLKQSVKKGARSGARSKSVCAMRPSSWLRTRNASKRNAGKTMKRNS